MHIKNLTPELAEAMGCTVSPPTKLPSGLRVKGRGRQRPERGTMNNTERAYSVALEDRRVLGEILAYWFEPITLRLAKRTSYTPDFLVMLHDGTLEFHEVKGYWEEDARAKIKIAVEMYWPFQFIAILGKKEAKKRGGGWSWKKEVFE